MVKALYSPRRIFYTALEKYLENEELEKVLNDPSKLEAKMKAIGFSIKLVAHHFGKQIEYKVEEDVIIFLYGSIEVYRLSNKQISNINVPLINKRINEVSVDVVERLWINLFFHYGNIINILEQMCINSSEIVNTVQTSLVV